MPPVSIALDVSVGIGPVLKPWEAIGLGFPVTGSLDLRNENQPVANIGVVVGMIPWWHALQKSAAPNDPQECPPEWMDPTCETTAPTFETDHAKYGEWFGPAKYMVRWTPLWKDVADLHLQVGVLQQKKDISFLVGGTLDFSIGESGRTYLFIDVQGGTNLGSLALGVSFELIKPK